MSQVVCRICFKEVMCFPKDIDVCTDGYQPKYDEEHTESFCTRQ